MPGTWAGRHPLRPAIALSMLALTAGFLLFAHVRSAAPELSLPFSGPEGTASAERAYGELPLSFERDAGRAGPEVDFIARTPGATTLVGPAGATLMLGEGKRSEALGLELAGGAAATKPQALERLPGEVNYLVGERSTWKREIATFERVRYPDVYPGIDLDWRGNQRQLEYDFRLAPGAEPARIAMEVTGAESLRLAASGDLIIDAGRASVRQKAPIAYQTIAGERHVVEAGFALRDRTIGFELGAYDRSRPLVIDPLVLAYSTYLGGDQDDAAFAIAVDGSGAAYVTGSTGSVDFNSVGQIEGDSASFDAFVSKLTPTGNALAYSTYLGGDASDRGSGIAVDAAGAAYVTGDTFSTDFDTVAGIEGDSGDANGDAFISKLTPNGGDLAYSTYLGGGGSDIGSAIAVDSAGAAYVTGETQSTDFNTVGQIESDPGDGFADAFIAKLTPVGTLAYSTYLGGNSFDTGSGIAVDSAGAAYVTGFTDSTDFNTVGQIEGDAPLTDAFVSKLNPAGSALAYSTYLGGNSFDRGLAIDVDGSGAAYITGQTDSTNFNTVNPIEVDSVGQDAFVSKLTPSGLDLAYSTYLGGNAIDRAYAVAVDDAGAAFVTGETDSTDFDAAGQVEGDSTGTDVFVSKLAPAGSALAYSTYLGGDATERGRGIAVDAAGAAYITGETFSTNFDTVGQIESDSTLGDAFVSKLTFDTDGDGIVDSADNCPSDAGPASNDGCPIPPPPAAKSSRALSLDTSKSKVKKGKKVTLSGTVDSPAGSSCVASQTVELQRVKKGSAFKTFTTDKTNATGKFALKVKVKKTYLYRAELGESAVCLADTSNTKKVKVKKKKRK